MGHLLVWPSRVGPRKRLYPTFATRGGLADKSPVPCSHEHIGPTLTVNLITRRGWNIVGVSLPSASPIPHGARSWVRARPVSGVGKSIRYTVEIASLSNFACRRRHVGGRPSSVFSPLRQWACAISHPPRYFTNRTLDISKPRRFRVEGDVRFASGCQREFTRQWPGPKTSRHSANPLGFASRH